MSAGRSIAGRISWVVRGLIPHNESGPRSTTSVSVTEALPDIHPEFSTTQPSGRIDDGARQHAYAQTPCPVGAAELVAYQEKRRRTYLHATLFSPSPSLRKQ